MLQGILEKLKTTYLYFKKLIYEISRINAPFH